MGQNYPKRLAPGVVARSGRSIQIEFRYRGERCRETFELDPAKKRNVNWAASARKQIKAEIATGKFDYAAWFPESPRAALSGPAAVTTVGDLLNNYLASCESTVERGDRIAQLVVAPVTRVELNPVEELPGTERGQGGFGSTG